MHAGKIFLIKRCIVMVGQENLNLYNLSRFKIFEGITIILIYFIVSMDGYIFTYRDNFSKIQNIALFF